MDELEKLIADELWPDIPEIHQALLIERGQGVTVYLTIERVKYLMLEAQKLQK